MDGLSTLLDGPRAQRAFALHARFAGSWSLSIEDEAALSVVVVAQGAATFRGPSGSFEARAGDVVLARGPEHFVVADRLDTPDDIRILPGQVCVDPQGALLEESMGLGVRAWGNTRADDATILLIGTYEHETAVGALVLAALPSLSVVHDVSASLVDLVGTELVRDAPGQEAVIDRLLDLLVVTVLRQAAPIPSTDPTVAQAIRLLEAHPAHGWTVASLASQVGLSRAALARRFTRATGTPPLTYLTRWRLALAADLLRSTDLTLAGVAARVGYGDPFALSVAFKREHGRSPRAYRRGSDPLSSQ